MKRKIGFILILIIEIALLVCCYVPSIYQMVSPSFPLVTSLTSLILSAEATVVSMVPSLSAMQGLPLQIILIVVANLIFLIFYALIFGIFAAIGKLNRKEQVAAATDNKMIVLTAEEEKKFDWNAYVRKFPLWRILFTVLFLVFVAFFYVLRLDYYICAQAFNGVDNTGFSSYALSSYLGIYSGMLKPMLDAYGLSATVETIPYLYFTMIGNSLLDSLQGNIVVELIIIGVVFILILVICWVIFSSIASALRNESAKIRAKKARDKYIRKLEDEAIRAWKMGLKSDRVSQKNDELNDSEDGVPEPQDDSSSIGQTTNNETNVDNKDEKDYIDDISTGVVDLGVVSDENDELQEPLTERETNFVGDEEVDIVIEEEPVIETIEEETSYYEALVENEESFNEYNPNDNSDLDIDDKIKKYNVDVIEEDEGPRHFEDESPTIQEYEEVVEEPAPAPVEEPAPVEKKDPYEGMEIPKPKPKKLSKQKPKLARPPKKGEEVPEAEVEEEEVVEDVTPVEIPKPKPKKPSKQKPKLARPPKKEEEDKPAKKAPAKKTAAKKETKAKKPAAKKPAAKKPATKKQTTAKKTAAKKPTAKKPASKTTKKSTTKKSK